MANEGSPSNPPLTSAQVYAALLGVDAASAADILAQFSRQVATRNAGLAILASTNAADVASVTGTRRGRSAPFAF